MIKKHRLFLGLVGVVAGILCGLFGVGGGVIIVLFISLFLAIDQHIAQGTAIAITFSASVVSTIIYYFNGYLDWHFIVPITLGSIIGGYFGAKLMNKIPSHYLQKFFAIFMIIAGIRMVWP